ncbi:quinone oxidoreductase family protein [Corynebacterium glyciniphilum]|uniref:quinone oxidoreductase family protein n=1 Tax=Corynebacterium glyciniphilum TaxID=1404244 RepID=UPI003FD41A9E
MKALQITAYTGPEGLIYQDTDVPQPGPGQISIDVEYAGANYVEALFTEGMAQLPLPWTPGIEAAGHVRALGEGVTGLAPGDAVAAPLTVIGAGGYGQIALAQAALTAPLPTGMDHALAAIVPSNTTTALAALERTVRMRPGEHVLVQAAVGGLGSQFGQIARLLGAGRVVGVVGSEDKKKPARDLGYDEVWLRSTLTARDPGQFDVIVDPVSGPTRPESLGLLRFEGRLLALGDAAQRSDQLISSNTLWSNSISVLGFNIGGLGAAHPEVVATFLRRALDLVDSGQVTVPVSDHVPIQDAPKVLTALRTGTTVGKTVLVHEPS